MRAAGTWCSVVWVSVSLGAASYTAIPSSTRNMTPQATHASTGTFTLVTRSPEPRLVPADATPGALCARVAIWGHDRVTPAVPYVDAPMLARGVVQRAV